MSRFKNIQDYINPVIEGFKYLPLNSVTINHAQECVDKVLKRIGLGTREVFLGCNVFIEVKESVEKQGCLSTVLDTEFCREHHVIPLVGKKYMPLGIWFSGTRTYTLYAHSSPDSKPVLFSRFGNYPDDFKCLSCDYLPEEVDPALAEAYRRFAFLSWS